MMKIKTESLVVLLLIGLFCTLTLIPVIFLAQSHCFQNFDLGIYSQGLFELSFDNPNPWLSVRQVNLFADHFDPILFISAFFAKFFSPSIVGIMSDHIYVILAALLVFYFGKKDNVIPVFLIFITAFVLFNRGTFRSMYHPFHPTSWSILPLAAFGYFLNLRNKKMIFVIFNLLCIFREEFSFMGIMVAFYFAIKRDTKFSLGMALNSVAWIVFLFILREPLFGETIGYASGLLSEILRNPFEIFKHYFTQTAQIRKILSLFLPLVPLWIIVYRNGIKPDTLVLLTILPAFLIRFLSVKWTHHYGISISILMLFIFSFKSVSEVMIRSRHKKIAFFICFFLLFSLNGRNYSEAKSAYQGNVEHCPSIKRRDESIKEAMTILNSHKNGPALVQSNLIPSMVGRGNIYQWRNAQKSRQKEFNYFFTEKPPYGVTEYHSKSELKALIEKIRSSENVKILMENEYIFLSEGLFSPY